MWPHIHDMPRPDIREWCMWAAGASTIDIPYTQSQQSGADLERGEYKIIQEIPLIFFSQLSSRTVSDDKAWGRVSDITWLLHLPTAPSPHSIGPVGLAIMFWGLCIMRGERELSTLPGAFSHVRVIYSVESEVFAQVAWVRVRTKKAYSAPWLCYHFCETSVMS